LGSVKTVILNKQSSNFSEIFKNQSRNIHRLRTVSVTDWPRLQRVFKVHKQKHGICIRYRPIS